MLENVMIYFTGSLTFYLINFNHNFVILYYIFFSIAPFTVLYTFSLSWILFYSSFCIHS